MRRLVSDRDASLALFGFRFSRGGAGLARVALAYGVDVGQAPGFGRGPSRYFWTSGSARGITPRWPVNRVPLEGFAEGRVRRSAVEVLPIQRKPRREKRIRRGEFCHLPQLRRLLCDQVCKAGC